MKRGWFGAWFGEWFSDWFGGGTEVPAPPVIGGGHAPELKPAKKVKKIQLSVSARQGRQTATLEVQTTVEVFISCIQARGRAAARVEYELQAVELPTVRRQPSDPFVPRMSIDTIGEYIPRPRPPIQHPPLRAPTRPQRQDARRPRKSVQARKNDDEEAIVKAIASLL